MKNAKEVIADRQEEIANRLDPSWHPQNQVPLFSSGALRYEISQRVRAIDCGGLGLIQQFAGSVELAKSIDRHVTVLKRHLPYFESDHIMNLTYNLLSGGQCLQDLEARRNDVGYLDAVGARRIPDPTTAGDFLRRFKTSDVEDLLAAVAQVRTRVWRRRPAKDRKLAVIDVDGTLVGTTGECKEGADLAYEGTYGYGPLVVSLATTQEVLYVDNRSASRPSQEGAVQRMDQAAASVLAAGFKKVRFRGDTAFTSTAYLDRWAREGHEFVFGMMGHEKVKKLANGLSEKSWRPVERRAKGPRGNRRRPTNHRQQMVEEKGYENLQLEAEHVAELAYRPHKAKQDYRLVILRKTIQVNKGQIQLLPRTEYFFYLTNIPVETMAAQDVVFESNARCHQENLIEQLKNQVHAMRMPAAEFIANWAYMVIGCLAWNLKIWLGLLWPDRGQGAEIVRMEFRSFLRNLLCLPAQIVHTGRQWVFRLLAHNRWVPAILETSHRLRQAQRC